MNNWGVLGIDMPFLFLRCFWGFSMIFHVIMYQMTDHMGIILDDVISVIMDLGSLHLTVS